MERVGVDLPSGQRRLMEEIQNNGEEQEIAQSESVTPQIENPRDENVPDLQPEQPEEKSWVSRLRRERDEAVRKSRMQDEIMAKLMTQAQSQGNSQPAEEDIFKSLADQEYVAGSQVANALKKQQEQFEKKLQEIEKRSTAQAINSKFSKLQQKYPDLAEVVNRETLEILAQRDPDSAELLHGKSDYEVYVLAYPMIKNAGILDQVPGVKKSKEVERKIEQNKKTVPSPQSFDKRPMAQAFNYTSLSPEQKQSLQREMMGYAAMESGVKPLPM